MQWIQFILFLLITFRLFVWIRAEYEKDAKKMKNEIEKQASLINSMQSENNAILKEIQDEVKSFHKRMDEIKCKDRK